MDHISQPTQPATQPDTAQHPQEVQCEDNTLSVGVATLAASISKPRDWAYSMKVSLSRGAVALALCTMGDMLSGMTTLKHASEKGPRRFKAGDHGLGGLAKAASRSSDGNSRR